ncbi:MAG: hypothetical protein ACI93S_000002 [Ancylomarina sp.]|jgi:hypothetical protein
MECLLPNQRDKLLKGYIDEAKINVTHIYLAQLLKNGYADYVLTVNFDNLMLRALALFNEFPSTYDMAILKDITTTKFKEKSVVYLLSTSFCLQCILRSSLSILKYSPCILRCSDIILNCLLSISFCLQCILRSLLSILKYSPCILRCSDVI